MLESSGFKFCLIRLILVFTNLYCICAVDIERPPQTVENDSINLTHFADKIYLDGIEAQNYFNNLTDRHYPCISLTRKYLNALKDKRFAFNKWRTDFQEDQRIKTSLELDQLLISCRPFYNEIIARTIDHLGILGEPVRLWFAAMEKYIQVVGNEGYARLIYDHNFRKNDQLMGILRETLKDPNKLDLENFGQMTGRQSGDVDEENNYNDWLMMRAYHAGSGLCNYIKNSPLSHLSHLLRTKIWADKNLNINNVRIQEELVLDVLNQNPLMRKLEDGSIEPIAILLALDYVCKDFKFYPTTELLDVIANVKPRGQTPVYQMHRADDPQLNRIVIHRGLGRYMSYSQQNPSLCSWFDLYKFKRIAHLKFDLGSNYADLDAVTNLAGNRFLEKCLTQTITHVLNVEKLQLWPSNESDKMIIEDLVRRLEPIPQNADLTSRLSDFIVRSGFTSIDDYGKEWLSYRGDFFYEQDPQSLAKLLQSFANGSGFCNFYLETLNLKQNVKQINWNLVKMIEVIDSMFDMMKFRPKITNDGLAFYYMWRFCWLNSLVPVKLKPITMLQQQLDEAPID